MMPHRETIMQLLPIAVYIVGPALYAEYASFVFLLRNVITSLNSVGQRSEKVILIRQKIYGQAKEGGAVAQPPPHPVNTPLMAGHRSGVQKRISEINPKALFVLCSNHSLNLACAHAASVTVYSVTCFGTLDQLFSFFSASTHRWDVLIQVTGLSIKRLVETRWNSRADAVNVVANKLSEVITALEQLTEEGENVTTRTDASLILTSLLSFPFMSFLSRWKSVLPEINDAQKYLQTKGLDLHPSSVRLTALRDYLLQNREAMVDSAMNESWKLCSEMGISRAGLTLWGAHAT
jgi:hypothetical protein